MNEEKRNIGGSVITSWERYKSNYDYKQNLELLLYYSKVLQTIDNQPTKKFRTTKYQDTHVEFFLEKFKFRRGFYVLFIKFFGNFSATQSFCFELLYLIIEK